MRAERLALLVVLAAASPGLAGCGREVRSLLLPNQPPELAPLSVEVVAEQPVRTYLIRWRGSDPDGRIDHYRFCLDPKSPATLDPTWRRTTESEYVLLVSEEGRLGPISGPGREPHFFVVRAVDNGGAMSAPQTLAIYGDNIPPVVRITSPRPSALLERMLPPTFIVRWTGYDPDGHTSTQPAWYKYRLYRDDESEFDLAVVRPDSLGRLLAPAFAGWDSLPGDATELRARDLVLGQRLLFALTAVDEAGDCDLLFSLDKNLFRFRVGAPAPPRLMFFGEGLPDPGWIYPGSEDPYVRAEIPAGQPVTVQWLATPAPGAGDTVLYRHAVDLGTGCRSPGPGAAAGDTCWSRWSPDTRSATVGPFAAGETHTLLVEAMDELGGRTLGVVVFSVIGVTLERPLLIVDDTRLRADMILGTNPDGSPKYLAPRGPWPTAAELDTFLYARGRFPWRGYPEGTVSAPGLFAGYDFDTLGTRTGRGDLTVPLATLLRYRAVVWLVDAKGATYGHSGSDGLEPMTALRYMCGLDRVNTLARYVALGGQLWLAGGGAAFASSIPFNDPTNDVPTYTFSSLPPPGRPAELRPGRFMYDLPMWQSEYRVTSAPAWPRQYLGRFRDSSGLYAGLPQTLDRKMPATDPVPPLRVTSDFYLITQPVEFLLRDNRIIEAVDGAPASTLDTLYYARGPSLPDTVTNPYNVVMTYYHGPSHGPVLFSGFSLWHSRRDHMLRLVDFVLQDLWGLGKEGAVSLRGTRSTATPGGRAMVRGGSRSVPLTPLIRRASASSVRR